MSTKILTALDAEISRLESQLKALREARSALGGAAAAPRGGRRRRRLTTAERAAISRRMKATWAKRKAASR